MPTGNFRVDTTRLRIIEQCFKAEAKLESGRAVSIKTRWDSYYFSHFPIKIKFEYPFRSELNQQAENLETEIKQLEDRIYNERKEATKVEEIIENSGFP